MDSDNESQDIENDDIEVDSDQDGFEEHIEMSEEEEKPYPKHVPVLVQKKGKYENDDEAFLNDAIAQISKMSTESNPKMNAESAGIKITTEGVYQDSYKNVNLAKISDLCQCHWCGKYFSNDLILKELDSNVCKHCFFSVNHDEVTRLTFDKECSKKGTGIALYIVECKDSHNTEGCLRHPHCYLCDFKLGIPIKNILNPTMIGVNENGVCNGQENQQNKNNKHDKLQQLDQHETVEFLNGYNSEKKVKVPSKLKI